MDLSKLQHLIDTHIKHSASSIDQKGMYSLDVIDALKSSGILGLLSSKELGGGGGSLRDAATVCEMIAGSCASTAMIMCMHFSAVTVIEVYGNEEVRSQIASGKHLSTLAFSEAGSRSHFWAPVSSAVTEYDYVVLQAKKSWITSASLADSYVWSSKPLEGNEASSIWLVDSKTQGLKIDAAYNGLGLRGNDSSSVTAESVKIPIQNLLGKDGEGFAIMMNSVLPSFVTMSASVSIGIMSEALNSAKDHITKTSYQHLSESISSLPTIRAYIAKAKLLLDASVALRDDTLRAIESERADTILRVLEVKALAAENALQVCDYAMRVCGGAAFRKETSVERNFRDSRASFVMAPTSDVLYDFIGKLVCDMPLF